MNPLFNRLDKFLSNSFFDDNDPRRAWQKATAYHYTIEEDVPKISREICCFAIRKYRALGEVLPGLGFLKSYFKDPEICGACAYCENMKYDEMPFWILSFSMVGCNQAIWNRKQETGHPRIVEFSTVKIMTFVQELMTKDLEEDSAKLHYFLPCLYLGKDDVKIGRLAEFLFGDYYRSLTDDQRYKGNLLVELCTLFALMIKGMGLDGDLSYENETRLILVARNLGGQEQVPSDLPTECIIGVKKNFTVENISRGCICHRMIRL